MSALKVLTAYSNSHVGLISKPKLIILLCENFVHLLRHHDVVIFVYFGFSARYKELTHEIQLRPIYGRQ